MSRSRLLLAALSAFAVIMSLTGGPAVAGLSDPGTVEEAPSDPAAGPARSEGRLSYEAVEPDQVRPVPRLQPAKETGPGLYLIRLADEPVAAYEGGLAGRPATAPALRRGDLDSAPVQSYAAYLEGQQDQFVRRATDQLGKPSLDVRFRYTMGNHGVAVWLTPEEAERVARVPGVTDVRRDELRELHTDSGPAWIGAPALWGDDPEPGIGVRGEGMVVGIIDTGITPSNPSFAAQADDGYVFEWDGDYHGACDPDSGQYDEDFPCNDKLIGAWGWPSAINPGGEPFDSVSHGTHVAGTAAGNPVTATLRGAGDPPATLERGITGVAPRAHIISYNGCCNVSSLAAAIDQAIADGVDAINYSIGSSGPAALWDDWDSVGFLNARSAGIFVATSAGNAGPGAATVGSPGEAPWITTVGASTHDRHKLNTVHGFAGGEAGTRPAEIVGKGFSPGYGPAPVVDAADYDNPHPTAPSSRCAEPFPADTFDGEIVICDRGTNARVAKGANVLAGGAGGMILANTAAEGDSLNGDVHHLPAVHVSYGDGLLLRAWLSEGGGHTAAISGTEIVNDADRGDAMGSFSSRGPNPAVDTIAPDVTAPGVDILAAFGVGDPEPAEWGFISGTSMSSPHVAGAALLLREAQPGWTPAEIQSALMSTAVVDGVRKDDGATPADPFDVGGGRIDLGRAAEAGLVLDESIANYLGANPSVGGDPRTLNLASMADSECLADCSWTRTVKAAVPGLTWTVTVDSPDEVDLSVSESSFTLADAGDTRSLTIAADVTGATTGRWHFGRVTLTPDDPGVPASHMPVAVRPTTGVVPALVDIDTRRDAGSQLQRGLQTVEVVALRVDRHGLVRGDVVEDTLPQDPTPGDPFDSLDDVWWTTVEVPGGAARLVAEVLETTAPDLDLFVGRGATPSSATVECSGTSPTSVERCDIAAPGPGTWWLLVQNWRSSAAGADPFALAHAVVPGDDAGNLSAEGPTSVGAQEPWDLRVFWDVESMDAGDRWYGALSLGSDADRPRDIATIPVDLVRHDDDVTKTVDPPHPDRGDVLTYTVTVQPTVTPEDLAYTITDTVPDGLTYVDGSVTGGATFADGVVTWTGVLRPPGRSYEVTTIDQDPSCAMPLSPPDSGYVNLLDHGIGPEPGIEGDGVWYTVSFSGAPIEYWGAAHHELSFTDDGFAFFDSTPGVSPSTPRTLPDEADPNSTLAMLWHDFEIVYEADARGVSIATLGGTGADSGVIVDFKGMQPGGGDGSATFDFQMLLRRSPGPGPEVIFAYDNLSSLDRTVTVGLEDALGEHAATLLNRENADGTIRDGFAVCFDWVVDDGEAHTFTYQASVDADAPGGLITNAALHEVDDPGSRPAVARADVTIPQSGSTPSP